MKKKELIQLHVTFGEAKYLLEKISNPPTETQAGSKVEVSDSAWRNAVLAIALKFLEPNNFARTNPFESDYGLTVYARYRPCRLYELSQHMHTKEVDTILLGSLLTERN